jgi:nucleotide-binding universal stress UspA family protein
MALIHHILCPIDFSPVSLRAFGYATAFARRREAALLALHVFNAPLALRAAFPQYAGSMLDSHARTRLLENLDDVARPARDLGIATATRVREGDIVAEILHTAQDARVDLIVIGTNGRSGVPRLMLGSVTEKVLRRAVCPVLTVPPAAANAVSESAPQFAKALCCVDFSEDSQAALEYGLALAREGGGTVSVMHVLEWDADDERLLAQSMNGDLGQRHETEVRARLQAAIAHETVAISELIGARGKPYVEIVQRAQDVQADVIVMGVGGQGMGERILGSTTDRVIRAAHCPVLTLRT